MNEPEQFIEDKDCGGTTFVVASDYWGPAAMHLLLCRKTFEECERCQEIAKKLDFTA